MKIKIINNDNYIIDDYILDDYILTKASIYTRLCWFRKNIINNDNNIKKTLYNKYKNNNNNILEIITKYKKKYI